MLEIKRSTIDIGQNSTIFDRFVIGAKWNQRFLAAITLYFLVKAWRVWGRRNGNYPNKRDFVLDCSIYHAQLSYEEVVACESVVVAWDSAMKYYAVLLFDGLILQKKSPSGK